MKKLILVLAGLVVAGSLLLAQSRVNLDPSLVEVKTVGGQPDDTINGLRLISMATDFEFRTVTLTFQLGEIKAGVFVPSVKRRREAIVIEDDGAVMTVKSPWVAEEITLTAGQRAKVFGDIKVIRTRFLNGAVAVGAITGAVE